MACKRVYILAIELYPRKSLARIRFPASQFRGLSAHHSHRVRFAFANLGEWKLFPGLVSGRVHGVTEWSHFPSGLSVKFTGWMSVDVAVGIASRPGGVGFFK